MEWEEVVQWAKDICSIATLYSCPMLSLSAEYAEKTLLIGTEATRMTASR